MRHSGSLKILTVCIFGLVLSACATENLTSEMYQQNFGLRELNGADNVDPKLLENGVYAPRFYTSTCLTADYRCAHQQQQTWSSFDP